MNITGPMLEVLDQLRRGKTTAFGYTTDTLGKTYINANTVKALIRRGLLKQCGQMPFQTYSEGDKLKGHFVPGYCISEEGVRVAQESSGILHSKNRRIGR